MNEVLYKMRHLPSLNSRGEAMDTRWKNTTKGTMCSCSITGVIVDTLRSIYITILYIHFLTFLVLNQI